MAVGLGDLQVAAREEIVDRGQARADRVAPGGALDRRQTGEGQRVGQGVHADVGPMEDVEPQAGDGVQGRAGVARRGRPIWRAKRISLRRILHG